MRRYTLSAFLICLASGLNAVAQIQCPTSGPVTNAKLVCIVPFATNVNNVSEAAALNGPIGAQLSQLPYAASVSGLVTYRDPKGNDIPYYNLGPIILDRPDSVGQGRLVFGFSFQQFLFNSINGLSIYSLPLVFHRASDDVYFAQTQQISFKYNQYLALATYGLPNNTDVTLLLPFSRVSVGVGTTPIQGAGLASGTPNYVHGSASGLGDIAINVKHVLWTGGQTERTSIAAGATWRFPSGDALNYLGSGAYGFNLYALASYKAPVSPHVKIGYQWNGPTVLLNPTGAGDTRLPGGFQSVIGVDAKIVKKVTFSIDLLGNQFLNSPSLVTTQTTVPGSTATYDTVCPVQPPPLQVASATSNPCTVNTTYTAVTLSTGLKWKPFRRTDIVLYGNLLTPLNNVGLRSDLVPSGGISYSFSPRTK